MKMNIPHKRLILALLLVLVAIIIITIYLKTSARLNGPESIAYDESMDRFFVSNTKGQNIMAMDKAGKLSKFIDSGFTSPKGIIVQSPYLYVADHNQLHIIDIPSEAITKSMPIEGSVDLNDISVDKNGLIYLTDTGANAVFTVDITNNTVNKIEDPLLEKPNGIVYDRPRNQFLIVCSTEKSPILSLSTDTMQVSLFMNTIYNVLDGIAIDELGRIYFSSWNEESIYMIPQEQNRFEVFRSKIKSPADLYYHQASNQLIVPLWEKNRIEYLSLQ